MTIPGRGGVAAGLRREKALFSKPKVDDHDKVGYVSPLAASCSSRLIGDVPLTLQEQEQGGCATGLSMLKQRGR